MRTLIRLIVALLALQAAPALPDTAMQPHESILAAIRDHIESNFRQTGENYRIELQPLDSRLQLAACTQPLQAFTARGSRLTGSVSVGVRCAGEHPWTIYHKAYVSLYRTVAVLANAVRPGAILTAADIATAEKDLAQLHGAFLSADQAIGKPIKRALPAGTVLTQDLLTTLRPVKRGDNVLIRSQSAGFEVTMDGIALMDGELGQRIRVRNAQSGRVIQATVSGEGRVEVRN